ncbi:MAG: hypothetical protein NVS3B10_12300 [Polyangiales bacterium]
MPLPRATVTAASLFAVLVLSGCPKAEKAASKEDKVEKSSKDDDDKKSDEKKGDDDDDGKKKKKPEKPGGSSEASAKSGHVIGGVDVPAWTMPTSHMEKCTMEKTDDARLSAIGKGNDEGAGFDDDKGDVETILTSMKKTCPSAGTSLSQSLNAGGYLGYSKKQYAKADGWFARALVADPSNTFARYNLACNLALEGNKSEALWNLEQLVPAANAGDPRALHYLRKAKGDSDLVSVRTDARYTAAVGTFDTVAAQHPECRSDDVWSGKDCIAICNAYGTQANCNTPLQCLGARQFGDGLVPYCVNPINCKSPEIMLFPLDNEGMAILGGKATCQLECASDGECPAGKKCTGHAANVGTYGTWMEASFCQ